MGAQVAITREQGLRDINVGPECKKSKIEQQSSCQQPLKATLTSVDWRGYLANETQHESNVPTAHKDPHLCVNTETQQQYRINENGS